MKGELIIRAAQLATIIHENDLRRYNGQPYIVHLMRVAFAVMLWAESTVEMVIAAYLHDTFEDHPELISLRDIEKMFGRTVASYVDWMTNKSKDTGLLREKRKELDRDRLNNASKEVKIIKMFDRIDNVKDLPIDNQFTIIYCNESKLLAEVLKDADIALYHKLMSTISKKENLYISAKNF